jgi:hypothetical protein
MPAKEYIVRLSGEEREQLETLVKKGKAAAHKRLHAQILLTADVGEGGPGWKDEPISQGLGGQYAHGGAGARALSRTGVGGGAQARPPTALQTAEARW